MKKVLNIVLILCVLIVLIFVFYYSIILKDISEIKLTKVNLAYSKSYVFKEKENIEKLLVSMEKLKTYKFMDNLLLDGEKLIFEITYTNGTKSEKMYENIRLYQKYLTVFWNRQKRKNQFSPIIVNITMNILK